MLNRFWAVIAAVFIVVSIATPITNSVFSISSVSSIFLESNTRGTFDEVIELNKSLDKTRVDINESFNITLSFTVIGDLPEGFIQANYTQDVLFLIDYSFSMDTTDPDGERLAAAKYYVDLLDDGDRGAVVGFNNEGWLVSTFVKGGGQPHMTDPHLGTNYSDIKENIDSVENKGGTDFVDGLSVAIEEFKEYGSENSIFVAIVFTDCDAGIGGWEELIDEAKSLGIIMFVVGINPDPYLYTYFEMFADITGGESYIYDTIDIMDDIYNIIENDYIAKMVVPHAYIIDTLTENIHFVENTTVRNATWTAHHLRSGEGWNITFEVFADSCGQYQTNIFEHSFIDMLLYNGTILRFHFPRVYITVGENKAPFLEIENMDDGFIKLLWSYNGLPVTHYLIFMSETVDGFDFSNPFFNTSDDVDFKSLDIGPLRVTANLSEFDIPIESYYIIRGVQNDGVPLTTSNTVGALRQTFDIGWNDFSLPFEPCSETYLGELQNRIGAQDAKSTHMYQKHYWSRYNNSLSVIDAIMLYFNESVDYVFTGFVPVNIHRIENTLPAPKLFLMGYNDTHMRLFWNGVDGANTYRLVMSYFRKSAENNSSATTLSGDTTEYFFNLSRMSIEMMFYIAPSVKCVDEWPEPLYLLNMSYSVAIYWLRPYVDVKYFAFGLPFEIAPINISDIISESDDVVGVNHFDWDEQRWIWHRCNMPVGVYDSPIERCRAYQVSTTVPFSLYIFTHQTFI